MENSIFQLIGNKVPNAIKFDPFQKKVYKEKDIVEKEPSETIFFEIFQNNFSDNKNENEIDKNILEALSFFIGNMLNVNITGINEKNNQTTSSFKALKTDKADTTNVMTWLSKLFDKIDEGEIDISKLKAEIMNEDFSKEKNIDTEKIFDFIKRVHTNSKKEDSAKIFESFKNNIATGNHDEKNIGNSGDIKDYERSVEKFLSSIDAKEKSVESDIGKDLFIRKEVQTLRDLNFSKGTFEFLDFKQPLNSEKSIIQNTTPSINMNNSSKISDLIELIEFVKNGETKKISVKLEPDFLGKMNIHLTDNAGKLSAKIFVEQDSVKHFLISNLETIKQQLNEKGIFIDNMDFMFMGDYKNQEEFKGQEKLINEKQKSAALKEEKSDEIKAEKRGMYA